MTQRFLSDLIEQHISLGREAATGFRSVRCSSCNDHKPRAGFKFDGETTGYSCFNCNAKFKYEEGSGKISKEVRRILGTFGITPEMLNEVTSSVFFSKTQEQKEITMEVLKPPPSLHTPTIELPPKCYPLGCDIKPEFQEPLIAYLHKRKLDEQILNAHFSLDPKFLNRVIIPCIRDNKIIFWQARTILNNVHPRYMSPAINKEAVMWGYDELWNHSDKPLFVTEGIFNASQVNGVALLGATLNEAKLEILNRCRRQKIIVVDKDNKGAALAALALKNKWEITFTREGTSDINDSVQKYGKLITIWDLMKNTTVPTNYNHTDGVSVQSKLDLAMQLVMTKLGK